MNNEPLLFDSDLVKAYADKRIGLEERDVKDLLRCMIGYLRQRVESKDTYAIDLGYVGVLHKNFEPDYEYNVRGAQRKLEEKMFIDFALLDRRSLVTRTPKFNNDARKELQAHTNSE